jgi:hypothetical protein
MPPSDRKTQPPADDRLAQALRENLRKRKAQTQARAAHAAEEGAEAPPETDAPPPAK